jgi:hypothetical protein
VKDDVDHEKTFDGLRKVSYFQDGYNSNDYWSAHEVTQRNPIYWYLITHGRVILIRVTSYQFYCNQITDIHK